ncbi:hypothetical protein [Poritiphilus flavus]|uniref:Uncharacterized protein n=1 Tax=Poritiphilus flavus TaxID=2697053 RepID=A0A6L9ED47_9FLAO|nr:hypothetical protein [Poritiphilus flavus]NAS12684.1 hypothetical protein [Poritiphilus flavus]
MRKTALLIAALFLLSFTSQAQESELQFSEGQVFVLGTPTGQDYQHIHFPRKNFLIKKGAIPRMKDLPGTQVYVDQVNYGRSGSAEIVLKRKDGRKFFRVLRSVKASADEALQAGEIKLWTPPKKEAIVVQ